MTDPSRNSILCPQCRGLISRDEPTCPYCGLARPGAAWRGGGLASLLMRANLVPILIGVNVAFYVLSLVVSPTGPGFSLHPLTFLSPSHEGLFLLGATGTLPISQFGRWWTLLTASFLHGGILHLFFNMAALSQLAPFVLREFGPSRFLLLYTAAGVAGFILSWLAGVPFTIGASAAVCGLIGAILHYGKSRGGWYGQAIYKQSMGWVVGLVLFGLLLPGINNWAHGGGLAAGVAGAFLLGYNDRRRETPLHHLLAGLCILATAGALLWALFQALYLVFS